MSEVFWQLGLQGPEAAEPENQAGQTMVTSSSVRKITKLNAWRDDKRPEEKILCWLICVYATNPNTIIIMSPIVSKNILKSKG